MGLSKGFFLHQAQGVGAFYCLILHIQSKKLYFFYAINLDHLFAKLFQESVFKKLLMFTAATSNFQYKPSFFIILDSTSPMKSLFLRVAEKKSLLSKIKRIRNAVW